MIKSLSGKTLLWIGVIALIFVGLRIGGVLSTLVMVFALPTGAMRFYNEKHGVESTKVGRVWSLMVSLAVFGFFLYAIGVMIFIVVTMT